MSQAPRYSDHDLEPLRAALLALAAGDFTGHGVTGRTEHGITGLAGLAGRAGPDVHSPGILGQIWPLVDAVATQLATLNAEAARRAEQVRDIATVTTAVARGDLARKVTVDVQGEVLQLKQFLANMSHELRTPLNSLLVLAKLLSENPDANLTVKQVEFARTIHDAGADLLQLIDDILDLSKVEAGKMDVHLAPIAVAELLDYVDATFRPTAAQKGLAFAVLVAPGVPPLIYADEQRLQQILRNLLSNAVKFTSGGGVTLRVAPAAEGTRFTGPLRDEKTVLAFGVTDTGIGIAEENLELIFDAFQQADGTTSRSYGGTGLGLSISRDIARLLGGEIHVRSELGRGSTFTCYLADRREAFAASRGAGSSGEERKYFSRTDRADSGPSPAPEAPGVSRGTTAPFWITGPRGAHGVTDGTTAPLAVAAAASGLPGTGPAPRDGDPLRGAKILIVDDDVRNVFSLTSVFERYGAVVRYAENGRAGLEILETEPDVGLVLIDVMMPELDGYATTAAIRRRREFAGLPIVMVTAKAATGDRAKAIAAGASEYVAKPVEITHLIGLMRGWLSRTAPVPDGP
jgi:signal transduction histidine kinase